MGTTSCVFNRGKKGLYIFTLLQTKLVAPSLHFCYSLEHALRPPRTSHGSCREQSRQQEVAVARDGILQQPLRAAAGRTLLYCAHSGPIGRASMPRTRTQRWPPSPPVGYGTPSPKFRRIEGARKYGARPVAAASSGRERPSRAVRDEAALHMVGRCARPSRDYFQTADKRVMALRELHLLSRRGTNTASSMRAAGDPSRRYRHQAVRLQLPRCE